MEEVDILWMKLSDLCAENGLESLHLLKVKFSLHRGDDFVKATDFLFPKPELFETELEFDEKEGIHRFSHLKCLKLCHVTVDTSGEIVNREHLEIFKDKQRIENAFPKLTSLVLHEENQNEIRDFASILLEVRASQIRSLHLKTPLFSFKCTPNNRLFFPSLSELCISGSK